jgi:drug/metabolite transporter (DMT)-like permease
MSRDLLLSSLCGCLASVAAKSALDAGKAAGISRQLCAGCAQLTGMAMSSMCESVLVLCVRVCLLLLMLLLNSAMLTGLVKALHAVGSARAASINGALSFLWSAMAGWLLFDERLSGLWLLGAALLLAGVALLQHEKAASATSASTRPR